MDKNDATLPPSTLLSASQPKLEKGLPFENSAPARTLVVLVPDCELDIVHVAQKVWELAYAFEGRIQFLGLCSDVRREPSLRRQLVSMSAMVANGSGSVGSKIDFGKNWLNFVKSNWREGDEIVCLAGHRTGLMNKELSQTLQDNLNATVYVLPGLFLPGSSLPNWLPSAIMWIGSIGLLALFFWLDVKIAQMPQDWAHTTLLYLSLILEVGLIWVWNNLF